MLRERQSDDVRREFKLDFVAVNCDEQIRVSLVCVHAYCVFALDDAAVWSAIAVHTFLICVCFQEIDRGSLLVVDVCLWRGK